jgi:hypothetical protein
MRPYSVVLFVHVLAAVVLVGHSLFAPFVHAAIRKATSPAALLGWLGLARDSARVNPLAALTLLATGVYLAAGRWSEGWLQVASVLFVVSSALAIGVVKATGERLARLAAASLERGGLTDELEALRHSRRWTAAADALLANDLAALYLMVAQPGLVGSILATVAANAALLAWRALRNRGAPAASRRLSPAA